MAGTLFANVRIIDGSGAEPFTGHVLVDGNRIKSVGRERPAAASEAFVVDGSGATLMPGLVEAHAHISFANTPDLESLGAIPPEEHTLLAARHAKLMLDQGFTSISSAAAAKPRLDVVIRNAINAGEIPGPRMLAATPEMTVSGGLGDVRLWHLHRETFAIVCDGPEEFRKVARQMIREGLDTLKINPSGDELVPWARAQQTVMNDAEVAAVCEVARQRGKRVAAHARSAESVKMCLRHGVDLIFHATFADAEAIDGLEKAKDRVFIVPTIGISYATLNEAAPWGPDDQRRRRSRHAAGTRARNRRHAGAQAARRAHPARRRLRLRVEPGRPQCARPRAFRHAARLHPDGGDRCGDPARWRDHDAGARVGAGEAGLSRRSRACQRQPGAGRQAAAGR
jgi:imidazolonepropionase-like amidohydrolase